MSAWEHLTKQEWAFEIKSLLTNQYPDAEKIVLVIDNLNTHAIASLYEAFSTAEALELSQRLEIHFTPKHGSWLNMAEIELSALTSQCLNRRIDSLPKLRRERQAWQSDRNRTAETIKWHFTAADARIRLHTLYQVI